MSDSPVLKKNQKKTKLIWWIPGQNWALFSNESCRCSVRLTGDKRCESDSLINYRQLFLSINRKLCQIDCSLPRCFSIAVALRDKYSVEESINKCRGVNWRSGEWIEGAKNELKEWRVNWRSGGWIEGVKNELKEWRMNWRSEEWIEGVESELKNWRVNWRSGGWIEGVEGELKDWRVNWRSEEWIEGVESELKDWRVNWKKRGKI